MNGATYARTFSGKTVDGQSFEKTLHYSDLTRDPAAISGVYLGQAFTVASLGELPFVWDGQPLEFVSEGPLQ